MTLENGGTWALGFPCTVVTLTKTSGPFRVTLFALATSLSCLICEINYLAADGKSPFSYGLQCYRGHVFLPKVSSSIHVTWSGISCSVYVIKKKKKA